MSSDERDSCVKDALRGGDALQMSCIRTRAFLVPRAVLARTRTRYIGPLTMSEQVWKGPAPDAPSQSSLWMVCWYFARWRAKLNRSVRAVQTRQRSRSGRTGALVHREASSECFILCRSYRAATRPFSTSNTPLTSRARTSAIWRSAALSTTPSSIVRPFFTTMWIG